MRLEIGFAKGGRRAQLPLSPPRSDEPKTPDSSSSLPTPRHRLRQGHVTIFVKATPPSSSRLCHRNLQT
ncbi:hypothetical protein ACE6H2_017104 [Prunus campanulata]